MRSSVIALAALALLALAACVSPKPFVSATVYRDEPPRDPGGNIEFIAGVPGRPHTVIADVRVVQVFRSDPVDPNLCIAMLKAKVLSIGADAVINYSAHFAPPGTVDNGSYTAQGVAVRWTGSQPAPAK